MITKVISGGQTGADQAGLRVAYDLGIETGGWAPKGWKTLYGPEPRLGSIFHLKEYPGGYRERTYQNVQDSNATIRFAVDFGSPGEMCTLKAIKLYKKPYIDVDLNNPQPIKKIADWINLGGIDILNIAGNAEKNGLNIFSRVYLYLFEVFKEIGF